MLALIRSLPPPVALVVGLIAGFAVAFPAGSFIGSRDGRAIERAASLQRSLDLIHQRSRTNAEINALGRPGLCRELGGVWLPNENHCE